MRRNSRRSGAQDQGCQTRAWFRDFRPSSAPRPTVTPARRNRIDCLLLRQDASIVPRSSQGPPSRLLLHLPAQGNDDVQIRHVLAPVPRLGGLHLAHHVHAVDDLAKDDVLAVQEGRGDRRDEELRAVGVGARVLRAPESAIWGSNSSSNSSNSSNSSRNNSYNRTKAKGVPGDLTAMDKSPG